MAAVSAGERTPKRIACKRLGRLRGACAAIALLSHVSSESLTRRAVWGAAPDTPARGHRPLEPQNEAIAWRNVRRGWLWYTKTKEFRIIGSAYQSHEPMHQSCG